MQESGPTTAPRFALRSAAPHLAALLVYTLLALVVTWPVLANFRTGLVGEVAGVDAYQNAWNHWWVAEALTHGRQPFWTPLLFYPDGVDLFWQTLGFSQGLLALPATLALGPLAGVNFTVLASFALGGYATFLLARRLTSSTPAALVAGAVFAFSPFHMEKVIDGNVEVAAIQWVPCYMLALHLLLERPGWRRALLCGALLLLASLGSWYYGLFCVLYTPCAVAIRMLGRERATALRLALWGALPLLIWGIVLAPKIADLALAGDQTLRDMRRIQAEHSADLVDFFLPSPVNYWWGPAVRAARDRVYPGAVIWNVALGWVGLALGAAGAIACWRVTWRWVLLLGATLVLAMGPSLRVAGYATGLPLPFALIQNLPGIRASQRPNHMVVVAGVLLAILAAYGVAWLARRLPARAAWPIAIGLVLAIVLVDAYPGPLRIVRRPVHPYYATLPAPDGALLPLPAYINVNRSENLTTQMVHRWPIVGGYVARAPAYPFGAFMPGLRELQDGFATPDDIVGGGWPASGRAALADFAIRYVTLDLTTQKTDYFAGVRDCLRELGVGAPLVADDTLEVYATPRSWQPAPLVYLGAGWQRLERQPATAFRWRWMADTADVRLYNPHDRPVIVTLSIAVAGFQQPKVVALRLDGARLGQLTAPPDRPATRQFVFVLDPGEHVVGLAAPAVADPARIGDMISVRVFQLSAAFSAPL
jgi:hypothetical protein